MHQTTYQIADKTDSKKLTEFLCKEGQFLLPIAIWGQHIQFGRK